MTPRQIVSTVLASLNTVLYLYLVALALRSF